MNHVAIERVHEDLIYIIECLAQDITGEARTEVYALEKYIQSLNEDQLPSYAAIAKTLSDALDILRSHVDEKAVRTAILLIRVRMYLRNQLAICQGKEPIYNINWPNSY
jgi:hypothetical protein